MPVPTDNQVLVQVRAAGVHRGDWHIMTGLTYMIRLAVPTLGLRKPKVPVLGMDVAGTVEAVGGKVTRQWEVVVDTGGRRTLAQLRRALTPKGTLVIVGGEGGRRWMGGFLRNLRAPVVSRFVGQRLRMLASKENQADLQALRRRIEAGKLSPLIG